MADWNKGPYFRMDRDPDRTFGSGSDDLLGMDRFAADFIGRENDYGGVDADGWRICI